jgi:hypothetical protein
MSEQLNELFTALAKAQSEMDSASKKSFNPFFKSKYADFPELIKASRESLTRNGLCVVQRIIVVEDITLLSAILGHSSGQWMESRMKINPPKSDIQSMGSYITYLKRYSYAALVGVATDDDDGEQAMQEVRNMPRKGTQSDDYRTVQKITPEQLEQLEFELKDDLELAEEVLTKMSLKKLSDMPKNRFMGSITRIREIKSAKSAKNEL